MSVDISVVIPVYNAGKYLRRCVDSVIRQTHTSLEIIFVDDGSADDSVEILEEYRRRDSRIRIIRQGYENAGCARNNGMKYATGKYIVFLDADDFFDTGMLERAFRTAEKKQAQLVLWGYYLYDNERKFAIPVPYRKLPENVFNAGALSAAAMENGIAVPWNKLILLSFLKKTGLQYQNLTNCNDEYFNRMIFLLSERAVYLKRRYVYYRVNNRDSLQGNSRGTVQRLKNQLACLKAIKEELIRRRIFRDNTEQFYYYLSAMMIADNESFLLKEFADAKEGYQILRERLIPDVFPSPDKFDTNAFIKNIYLSKSFEEFLFLQNKARQNSMVLKSSKDYMLGNTLLTIPRKIRNMFIRAYK